MRRKLIVNADDLGLSAGVNAGVALAADHGIVTSASLMVKQPAAEEAAEWARRHQEVSVGLHADLAEWVYTGGEWQVSYQRVDPEDEAAVERELREQLELFVQLVGMTPTHIDSHQHVHRDEPAARVFRKLSAELGVSLRLSATAPTYVGGFYGQDGRGVAYPELISETALDALLRELADEASELGCHPAAVADTGNKYDPERCIELATLLARPWQVQLAERGIDLVNFRTLAAERPFPLVTDHLDLTEVTAFVANPRKESTC